MTSEPLLPLPPAQDEHARPAQCPNCGASEWTPVFRKRDRTLIGYECSDCWTYVSKSGDLIETAKED